MKCRDGWQSQAAPAPTVPALLQLFEKLQARTTQLSHSQIPDPWKLRVTKQKGINFSSCLSFR